MIVVLPVAFAPDKATFRSRFNAYSKDIFKDINLLSFGLVVAGGSVLYCILHDPTRSLVCSSLYLQCLTHSLTQDTQSSAFRDTDIDLFPINSDGDAAGRDVARFVQLLAKRLPDADVDVTLKSITLRVSVRLRCRSC
jgi:hypothetical protein